MHGHYSKKYKTSEEIIKNIDSLFGSRISIVKCIAQADKLGFIEKKSRDKDKRNKSIIPTKKLIDYFEDKITYFKILNIKLTDQTDSDFFII